MRRRRVSSASRGRCSRSSRGCQRRARDDAPSRRASAASPAHASCSAAAGNRTRRQKVRLEDRLQHQLRRHLHHPVPDRRDPQRPLPAVALRDVPAQDQLRPIPPRPQLVASSSRKRSTPYCSTPAIVWHRRPLLLCWPSPASTPPKDVTPLEVVVQRVEPPPGDRLAATHSRRCSCRLSRAACPPGSLGPLWRPFPRAYLLRRRLHPRDLSLPRRCSSPPSPVLRSPRTPAAHARFRLRLIRARSP